MLPAGAAAIGCGSCQSLVRGGRTHWAHHSQVSVGFRCIASRPLVSCGSLFDLRANNHSKNNQWVSLRKLKPWQWRGGCIHWLCYLWVSIPSARKKRLLPFLCTLPSCHTCLRSFRYSETEHSYLLMRATWVIGLWTSNQFKWMIQK